MTTRVPRKIPTVVGIVLVAALVAIVGYAFNTFFDTNTDTSAKSTGQPRQVEITNISDTSCTVTWTTDDLATGVVVLEHSGISEKSIFDDRDASGKLQKYISHTITIRGLDAATTYTFSILSNGVSYTGGETPYACVTAPEVQITSNGLEPAYGTVTATDGKPVADAIIYLTVNGSQVLSSVTKYNGSWLIPLNLIRTEDLTSGLAYQERIDEQIIVRKGTDEASAVTDTLNDSPVPDMQLGKSYDFRKQQADSGVKQTASLPVEPPAGDTAVLGEKTQSKPSKKYTVTLTQPKEDAALVANLPLFEGTGVPGNTVSLTIGIKSPMTYTTKVGTDGLWRFTPPSSLPAGKQSVTVTSSDSTGKNVAITRMFDILKSGTQVLGEATASGSLSPTPQPTETPAPTPVPQLTDMPTPTPEPIYTPAPVSSVVATPTPPVTGTVMPTVVIIAVSAGFLLSGLLLAVL